MARPTVSTNRSPISAVIDEWQVEYSRFISYSSVTSAPTHPSLSPVDRNRAGTWLSSAGASSLKLKFRRPSTGVCASVIVISLRSRVLEEHYISKMHFSWPQVSCVSGFPERGSRAVFVGYEDGAGQIQKFALRFLTIQETDKFMSLVKELLETESPHLRISPQLNPQVSSHTEVISSDGPTHNSPLKLSTSEVISSDGPTHSSPVKLSTSELYEAQDSVSHERIGYHETPEEISEFPPSFTQLVKNCHPETTVSKGNCLSSEMATVYGEDLKTQFLRYLEITSFTDLLATVDDVINVLEGDLAL